MTLTQAVAGRSVYLSGPITRLGEAEARRRFDAAERRCVKSGAAMVFNPMSDRVQKRRDGWTHDQHMTADLHTLTARNAPERPVFDVLVQLAGWSDSKGAKAEAVVADACGIERYYLGVTA